MIARSKVLEMEKETESVENVQNIENATEIYDVIINDRGSNDIEINTKQEDNSAQEEGKRGGKECGACVKSRGGYCKNRGGLSKGAETSGQGEEQGRQGEGVLGTFSVQRG